MPFTRSAPRIAIKVTNTFQVPIEGSSRSEAILDQLLIDEHWIINSCLAVLAALRPPRLSRNDAVALFGKTTSEHFAIRGTDYTKQILAEGIATKVYEQFQAQSKAFRRTIFRTVRSADRIDFMLLRQTIEAEGGTWKALRLFLGDDFLPFGVSAKTAGEFAGVEPLRLRPIKKPLAYLRTRTARFVRTRRGNYGVKMVHPLEPGRHLFFRVRGRGHDEYIEQLLRRAGQDAGTFTAEIRRGSESLVLYVLFSREVPPANDRGETYVGVDLGLVNIAVAAAVDPLGRRLIRPKFWHAGPLRHRLRVLEARNTGRRTGHKQLIPTANHTRYWTYRISHEIVEFAKGFPSPVIVLENLRGFEPRRYRRSRRANRRLHSWDRGRLREFLKHVAGWQGIRIIEVNPRGTSSVCPKCGSPLRRDRVRHRSVCENLSCRYVNNDDLVGAFNIALRGAELERSGTFAFAHALRVPRLHGVAPERLFHSTPVYPNVESPSSAGSEGMNAMPPDGPIR